MTSHTEGKNRRERLILVLLVAGLLSLFPNLNLFEFRGEESLRTIVAFEMYHFKNFIQPTFLGDLYFNKPPLFNWLIILSSFVIPWSELTARIVTISALALSLLIIYKFSFRIFNDRLTALFSALIYLTFLDILFWYGFLAEIDVTLSMIIILMIYFQYFGFLENKRSYILLSGITAGVGFLLKGFPAFVFFGLTYISLILFTKRFKDFLNPYLWISGITAVFIPLVWIINTEDPKGYINRLFFESLMRAEGSTDLSKFLIHLIEYPLLNLKQMIPWSIFGLFLIYLIWIKKERFNVPTDIKIILLITAVNYLPYILAVESRGRYIIPLFPLIAVVLSYMLIKINRENIIKYMIYTASVFIVLRFLVGFIGIPIYMEKKASRKEVAYSIVNQVDLSKKIACDCYMEKSVCLYVGFEKNEPIIHPKYVPNWNYLITCHQKEEGELIKEYNLKGKKVYLYRR